MREHCCCDHLTAALITAWCSVSTLGVNTADVGILQYISIQTHTQIHTGGYAMNTEAEQQGQNVNDT